MRIKSSELNERKFEDYPVWTWDEDLELEDDENWVIPVRETNELSKDYTSIFVKAKFTTEDGIEFQGYIISDGFKVFCIGIFWKAEKYTFNNGVKSLSMIQLERLRKSLGNQDQKIFPLKYQTDLNFYDGEKIEGEFNLS